MKTAYYGGRVFTGSLPLCEAFIVENGRFVFAGSEKEALTMLEDGDKMVSLQGKFACPGFIDSHMHILSYGNSLMSAALHEHTSSLSEMIDCFRKYSESPFAAKSKWLIGRGWNHDYFSDADRMPNRYDLDKVSREKPVVAVRCCGHCLAVNSRALEILNISADTPSPEGGSIGVEKGEADGLFFDNAMDLVYNCIPQPEEAEILEMMRASMKALNAFGITSCHSDDYTQFAGVPWQTVKGAFEKLEKAGEMTVRVYEQSNFSSLACLQEFVKAGNVTGKGSEMFKTGPLKMLGDGSLGSRTAYLSRPYHDQADTRGLMVFDDETLESMILFAHESGMQCAVHAIGDGCLDSVLRAYEKALHTTPRPDHRHGIVHCQITRADQLEKIRKMNLHVYAQSIFIDYDSHIVEKRVGKALSETSYQWKTLMDGGVVVSNGTDCPVEMPDAMKCMQCAVTRTSMDGVEYLKREAFSVEEALQSYTKNGAHAAFEENIKGEIRPGMLADFVILGANPFETDAFEIKDIPVLSTYLGGRKVFENTAMISPEA